MKDMPERIAKVEQIVNTHGVELERVRTRQHDQANMLQNHAGILSAHSSIITGIDKAIAKLSETVGLLSLAVNKIIWLSIGGMAVGTVLLGAIIYLGKDIFKLW